MSYEYEDDEGMNLRIATVDRNSMEYVGIEPLRRVAGSIHSGPPVHVRPEDAPAVALAILEAAGFEPSVTNVSGKGWRVAVNEAAFHLVMAQGARRIEAEREAEDTKVAAFRKASDPGNHFEWHELKPEALDAWRARYRAARDFFRESQ